MSSGPPNSNWVSPSQMKEVLEFNASLTRAGQKSRPGRSGAQGSGINRGGGSGYAPGRPANYATQNMARAGSGVRADPRMNYTVGPTTAHTIIRPSNGGRSRSRSPTRSASTPSAIGPYDVGPLPTPTLTKPPSPPKIRASVLVPNGTVPMEQEVGMPPAQQQHTRRQLIVSNMTEDDRSKPWIPAHLMQKDAFETIRHLSEMTGINIERLTSDGISIPGAPENRSSSVNNARQTDHQGWPNHAAPVSASTVPVSTFPVNTRTEVDPNTWMAAYANKNNNNGSYAAQAPTQPISEPSRVASYSEMDVDMENDSGVSHTTQRPNIYQVGTLADSRWASTPQSNNFGAASTPSTTFQGQQSFGGMQNPTATYNQTRNTFGNMENVKPAASGAPTQLSTTANSTDVLTRALAASKPEKKLATLQDSRWA